MTYEERLDRVSAVERGTFDRPALTIVAGLTYRERSQVFNRWLVPAYQMSVRWTGNRLDAEDATTRVLINEMSRVKLPDLVQVVDERLAETTLEAIGRHWSERYGISPLRCSAIHAAEAALLGRPALTSDGLTDRLTAGPAPRDRASISPQANAILNRNTARGWSRDERQPALSSPI
jgi:hypothetical protein